MHTRWVGALPIPRTQRMQPGCCGPPSAGKILPFSSSIARLLDTPAGRRPYPGDDFQLPFGKAAVVQPGRVLTVVTWGAMVHRCLEAAEPFGDDVEILDLRTIIPWDKDAVLASVRNTGKCLVVHEDTVTGGFGGEIIATLAAEAFSLLDAPLLRVATANSPVPYNIGLMNAVIPGVELIRSRMAELLAW